MDQSRLDEVFLRRLSSHIGDEWQALGIHLGFRPDQIERLGKDYACTEDKIFNMLVDWKQVQTRGTDCTNVLVDALTCCGRNDLATNLHRFLDNNELSCPPGLDNRSLELLSSRIGTEWQTLAIRLGLRTDVIDKLKQDNPKTEDRVFNMLVLWRRTNSQNGDLREQLSEALNLSGRADLGDALHQVVGTERCQEEMIPKETPAHSSPLSARFLKVCQKELVTFYEQHLGTVQLLPWGHDVADMDDIFVDLTLNVDGKLLFGSGSKTLKCSEDVLFLEGRNGQRLNRVFVTGYAGSGKSTSMAKLAYDWARALRSLTQKTTLSSYKLLFILSLREMDMNKSLVDAIFDQILPFDTRVKQKDLETYLESHGSDVLILFDGLDENSSEGIPKKLVDNALSILANRKMRDTCVVVTSRPYKLESLGEHQKQYVQVRLAGFSEGNIDVYIKKFFKDNEDAAESLAAEIRQSPSVKRLAQIPVMILMLCLLWSDDQSLPERYTDLYEQVVHYLWRRYLEAYQTSTPLIMLILSIGKVALEGNVREEKCVFLEDEFPSDVLSVACQVGILTKERLRSRLNMKTAVSFLHKSIQDYAAARYWVSLLTTDCKRFTSYLDDIKDDSAVLAHVDLLSFACGMSQDAANLILPHAIKILQHRTNDCLRIGGIATTTKNDVWPIFRILRESTLNYQSIDQWLQPLLKSHSVEIRQNPSLVIKDFHHIVKIAARCTKETFLSTVVDVKVYFSSEAMDTLAEILHEMKRVETLLVSWEPDDPNTVPNNSRFHALSNAMGKLSSLRNLTVLATGRNKPDLSSIIKAIQHNLRNLEMGNVDFDTKVLSDCLARQRGLKSVSLSNTTLTSTSASAILSQLHPSLEIVHLVSSQIGDAVKHLKPLMHSLLEVVMRATNLDESHVGVLADYLTAAPKLKHLDLSWNNVGSSTGKLASQLRHCASLETLSIINASLSQDGTIALMKNLKFLPELTNLTFSLGSHSKCGGVPPNDGFVITEAILRAIPHVLKLQSLYAKHLEIPQDSRPSDMVGDCLTALGFQRPVARRLMEGERLQRYFGFLLNAEELNRLRSVIAEHLEKENNPTSSQDK